MFCEKREAQYHPVEFNHLGVILDNKEKAGELFKALQKIPDNQRIAFTLSKIEGLNNNEIAEIKINTPGLCKGSGNSQWLFHSCSLTPFEVIDVYIPDKRYYETEIDAAKKKRLTPNQKIICENSC